MDGIKKDKLRLFSGAQKNTRRQQPQLEIHKIPFRHENTFVSTAACSNTGTDYQERL